MSFAVAGALVALLAIWLGGGLATDAPQDLPEEDPLARDMRAPLLRGSEAESHARTSREQPARTVIVDVPEQDATTPRGLLIVRGRVVRDASGPWPEGSRVVLSPVAGSGWSFDLADLEVFQGELDDQGAFEVDLSSWMLADKQPVYVRVRSKIPGFTSERMDVDLRTASGPEEARVLEIEVRVVPAVLVRGRFVDERGDPVVGEGQVSALPWPEGGQDPAASRRYALQGAPITTPIEDGGVFELVLPRPGRYWFSGGTRERVPVARAVLVTAAGMDLGDVLLGSGHALRGRVTLNGEPFDGASVWIHHEATSYYHDGIFYRVSRLGDDYVRGPDSLRTDKQGHFEAHARPEGAHRAAVIASLDLDLRLPQQACELRNIAVPSREPVHVALVGCVLTVRVEDASKGDEGPTYELQVNGSGDDSLRRGGQKRLLVPNGEAVTLKLEVSGRTALEERVEIPAGVTAREIVLRPVLEPMGTLVVRPLGDGKALPVGQLRLVPLVEATESLVRPPGMLTLNPVPDPAADGSVRWANVPVGRYRLEIDIGNSAVDSSSMWVRHAMEVRVDADVTTRLSPQLQKGGRLRIELRDAAGARIEGAATLFEADGETRRPVLFQTSDDTSILASTGVFGTGLVLVDPAQPPGEYVLELAHGDAKVRKRVHVRAGEVTVVEATLPE